MCGSQLFSNLVSFTNIYIDASSIFLCIQNFHIDCTAKVWDLERGIELATLPKHPSYVRKVLYSEASNLLFTAFQSQIKVLIYFVSMNFYAEKLNAFTLQKHHYNPAYKTIYSVNI